MLSDGMKAGLELVPTGLGLIDIKLSILGPHCGAWRAALAVRSGRRIPLKHTGNGRAGTRIQTEELTNTEDPVLLQVMKVGLAWAERTPRIARNVRGCISEPERGRRRWKDKGRARKGTNTNRRWIRGERGRRLMRRRGGRPPGGRWRSCAALPGECTRQLGDGPG